MIIHPGETLKEVLDNRNVTPRKLSLITNESIKYINNIIDGKENITLPFAKKLEKTLSINSSFWINLQANYNKEISSYILNSQKAVDSFTKMLNNPADSVKVNRELTSAERIKQGEDKLRTIMTNWGNLG